MSLLGLQAWITITKTRGTEDNTAMKDCLSWTPRITYKLATSRYELALHICMQRVHLMNKPNTPNTIPERPPAIT